MVSVQWALSGNEAARLFIQNGTTWSDLHNWHQLICRAVLHPPISHNEISIIRPAEADPYSDIKPDDIIAILPHRKHSTERTMPSRVWE